MGGGTLALTLREPDGTTHRMCRWTNATPYFIHNVRLLQKSPLHVQQYLQSWNEMVEDWKQARGHPRKCKRPMTYAYAPYPYLAPHDDGLVVVDMQKDQILHMQGVTDYGKIPLSNEEEATAIFQGLVKAYRVMKIVDPSKKNPEPVQGLPWSKLKRLLTRYRNACHFTIDMSRFAITRFAETAEGATTFRQAVRDLGFSLSAQENELWDFWINERKEQEK